MVKPPLDFSSFCRLKINNFQFVDCRILEVDFSEAKAKDSFFDNCDLSGALFNETNLENVNFKTSRNFSIDLDTNVLKGAVFSKENISGLLEKYKINIE